MWNPFKKQPEIKLTRYQKRHKAVSHIIVDGREVYIPYYVRKLAKANHERFPEISEQEFYDGIYKALMRNGKTKDAVDAGERLIYRGLVNRIKSPIGKRLFVIRFKYLVLKMWWAYKAKPKLVKTYLNLKLRLSKIRIKKIISKSFPK